MPKKKPLPTRRDILRWMSAGAASSVVGIGAGAYRSSVVETERRVLKLPNWDADGFRVTLLSDFHLTSPLALERAKAAAEMALATKPNAIVMPGDFVESSNRRSRIFLQEFLKAFESASCPVLATLGNHDYWTAHPPGVIRNFGTSPVRLLRNEAVEVAGVTIAGIDDGLSNKHDLSFLRKGAHSKSLIALFHEPDYVVEVPDHVSLQLSGHSHGGQVCLPFGIPLHTPKGARNYIDGFYPNAKVPLFVTRGVGTTGPDWRLFCPPHVVELTLQRA